MEVQLPRRSRQRDIREMADVTARGRLDYLWAAAVAENDLAFRTSSSKAMQAFVDAVAAFGKAYTLPSAYKVAGPLLVKLKLDTEELIKPIKESWPRSGCTLTMDGWTCLKSRGMICVIAQNDTAPVIVDCVDSKTAKKAGEYLAKLIQHAICEVGDSHVVQVVMDNAANNKRTANLLKDGYPQVFFTNCAAHVLDLMLHYMGKVKAVKRVLNQVHRVVMMVKGSASAVTLFRELFSKLALVRPGATRFGTQVIMIERFLEVKKALKEMVISEEWKSVAVANTEEGHAVRGLLLEETFWDSVTAILGLMKPIYEVLRIVDRRSLVMGSVYGLMLEATVKSNEAATKAAAQLSKKTGLLPGNKKAAFLAAFKAIIANRWDGQLHNPLHALGWLLNPKNQYVGEIREDAELRAGAEEVFKARGGSVEMRTMLAVRLAAFHKGEGKLGSVDARWAATILVESGRLSAAEWWALYGGEVRALQKIAVMLLSQPVTSSEVERYWSALARVQRRDRNRLNATSMTDVAFVAFGRRARESYDKKTEARAKLYSELSNGSLQEGSTSVLLSLPVEAEVDEEEEAGGEPCTIDWDTFGNIGKRVTKRKRANLKKKKKKSASKGSGSRKGKEKVCEEEEEEAEDGSSDDDSGPDEPTKRKNKGVNARTFCGLTHFLKCFSMWLAAFHTPSTCVRNGLGVSGGRRTSGNVQCNAVSLHCSREAPPNMWRALQQRSPSKHVACTAAEKPLQTCGVHCSREAPPNMWRAMQQRSPSKHVACNAAEKPLQTCGVHCSREAPPNMWRAMQQRSPSKHVACTAAEKPLQTCGVHCSREAPQTCGVHCSREAPPNMWRALQQRSPSKHVACTAAEKPLQTCGVHCSVTVSHQHVACRAPCG
ncbi:unnamed protein product [Closterium sp. NIES-65]|nr:unnamed protein product [Closterium sp. NIES-65]